MVSKPLKVYIESSVLSGYGRKRYHDVWVKFFDLVRAGKFEPVISDHCMTEVRKKTTPIEVLENLNTFEYTFIIATDEMDRLTDKYMEKKIVVPRYKDDARHIAIATVLEVDVLVAWNMTHINNPETIPLFNKVNIKEGYKPLLIKKPEEIM